MFRSLILVTALPACLTAGPTAAQTTTVPLDVYGAYLHVDPADQTNPAVGISLGALGLVPGYTIGLECAGDWNAGPGGDIQTNLLAVFSGDATLLGTTLPHRVPAAIDAGVDNFTGGTWPNNQPTEIPEDFTVGRPGISIIIPAGAKFLFVTPADIYYRDNSDPDADLGVTITLLSTVPVPNEGTPARLRFAIAGSNPIADKVRFRVELPAAGPIVLEMFDTTGRRVADPLRESRPAGRHEIAWEARGLAPGVYLARLTARGERASVRVIRTP